MRHISRRVVALALLCAAVGPLAGLSPARAATARCFVVNPVVRNNCSIVVHGTPGQTMTVKWTVVALDWEITVGGNVVAGTAKGSPANGMRLLPECSGCLVRLLTQASRGAFGLLQVTY